VDDTQLLDNLLGLTGGDSGVTRNGGSAESHGDDTLTADVVVTAEVKDAKEECRDESTMAIDILSDLTTVSRQQQQQQQQLVQQKKVPKKLKNAPVSIMVPIKEEEVYTDKEEERKEEDRICMTEEVGKSCLDEEVRVPSTRAVVGNKQLQPQQKAAPINVSRGIGLSGTLQYDDDDDDDDEPTTGVVIVTVEEKKEEWSREKIMTDEQQQHDVGEEESSRAISTVPLKFKDSSLSRLSLIEEEKDNIDVEEETTGKGEERKEPILQDKVHGPSKPAVVRNGQSELQHATVGATRRILSIIPHSLTMHPMFRCVVIIIIHAVAALLLTRMFRSQPTDTAISRQPSESMSNIPNLGPVDGPVVISQHLDEIKSFNSFDMDESDILDLDEEETPIDELDMSARVIKDLIHETLTTEPDNSFATNNDEEEL